MPEITIPEISQDIARRPVRREAMPTFTPTAAGAQADFWSALSAQGRRWYTEIKEREAFEQFARAQTDTLQAESDYSQWQRDNSLTPDTDLIQYDKSMEQSRQNVGSYLTNGVAQRRWQAWEKQRDIPRREAALGNMLRISDEARLARFRETALEFAKENGYEATLKQFTDPDVLAGMDMSLGEAAAEIRNIKTLAQIQRDEAQSALNEQREKDRDEIGKMIDDPTKSYADISAKIEASTLDEKEQAQKKKDAEAIKEARAVPYAKVTDDATFIKANEVMDDYQQGLVGKEDAQKQLFASKSKLTKADYESVRSKFIEAQDPDSPLKRPSVKRAFELLEDYKNIRLSIMKREGESEAVLRDELLIWNGIKNGLEHWVLQEDRTDKEIEAQLEYLTAPKKEEITGDFLSRLWKAARFALPPIWQPHILLEEGEEEPIEGEPVIKTQAEYNALPSGTIFIDTDGTRVRKK